VEVRVDSIGGRIWSLLPGQGDQPVECTVREVTASDGYEIGTYPELVEAVASIGYLNHKHDLFFRGQATDHRKASTGRYAFFSEVYPTAYRATGSLSEKALGVRLKHLEVMSKRLAATYPYVTKKRIRKHMELRWALLQHYGVCRTPLLDVTQSLRVAASFASLDNDGEHGWLFLFGLPNANGSISFHVDDNIVLVRLQSVCPPEAKRAHFQEGYLVGHYPLSQRKYRNLNLDGRMLAKFKLRMDTLWSRDFPMIPRSALMPEHDVLKDYFAGEGFEFGP
jgi:hypothetical protein